MKTSRMRLDQLLFERGLADSREKAKALIEAGATRLGTSSGVAIVKGMQAVAGAY